MSYVLLLLLACRFEAAPVTDGYFQSFDEHARTALGARTTYTAGDFGSIRFGDDVAFGDMVSHDGSILITESHADSVCDRRIRALARVGAEGGSGGFNSQIIECTDPSQTTFGTDLQADEHDIVTGHHFRSFTNHDHGTVMERIPAAADGFTLFMEDRWTSLVGTPSTNQAHILRDRTSHQNYYGSVDGPPGAVGFGTGIFGSDMVVAVTDAAGFPYFYAIDEGEGWFDHDTFIPIANPGAHGVLAAHENEFLVRRGGDPDLYIVRWEDGAWATEGPIVAAADWYTEWAFDEVAIFGVTPRGPGHRGVVDRFDRLTGELDASLSLVRPHDSVSLDLEDNWLAIGEAAGDGTGAVHVFNWRADREAKFRALGGQHLEMCMLHEEGTAENPLRLEEVADDRYFAWGDIDFEGVTYEMWVGHGQTATIELTGPDGAAYTPAYLDVESDQGSIWTYQSAEDVVTWYGYHENGWGSERLTITVDTSSSGGGGYEDDIWCTPYELSVAVVDDPGVCADALSGEYQVGYDDNGNWGTHYVPPSVFDAHGLDQGLWSVEVDRYELDLAAGDTVEIEASYLNSRSDASARIVDRDGDVWSETSRYRSTVRYTANEDVELYYEVHGGGGGRCARYMLDVAYTPAPADDATEAGTE